MPVLCTSGTGSGLGVNWSTPCAMDSNPIQGGNLYQTKSETVRHRREDGRTSNRGLSTLVKWATPAARDMKGANSREHCETRGTGRKHMGQLANQVAHPDLAGIAGMNSITDCWGGMDARIAAETVWQTPVADDAVDRAAGKVNSRGEPKLSAEVKLFPTPRTPSPTGGGTGLDGGAGARSMMDADTRAELTGASLNPDWVEWLMGWPIGWTRLEPMTELRWEPLGVEPVDVPRVGVNIPNRQARLRCIGNGQVPQAAALAWGVLTND